MAIITVRLLGHRVENYHIVEVKYTLSVFEKKYSMDELPFIVILIKRLRAVAVWKVAVIFAVLLYFDFTKDEYVAAVLTSVFIFFYIYYRCDDNI